jgi:carbonic anhydrase/acetyltransferase-like protein (isoleucine patch superfamily)
MGGALCAALRRSETEPAAASDAVAPPTALPRSAGWRDRRRLKRTPRVTAGRDVVVGRRVVLDVAPGGHLTLDDGVALGDGTRLHVATGAIVTIGPGTRLGESCVITAHGSIAIGARCLLADEVVLIDSEPDVADVERPLREQGLSTKPIRVGDDVRIGPAAALLAGVRVQDGAHVPAHATLSPPPPAPPPPARPARGGAERR